MLADSDSSNLSSVPVLLAELEALQARAFDLGRNCSHAPPEA